MVNRDECPFYSRIAAKFRCDCAESQQTQKIVNAASVVTLRVAEQSELRRIARGLGKAEMLEGVRGQEPSARRALQIAALDQEGLDDVLDGIARLRQRRRHGLHADRPAAVVHRDGGEITPV